MDNVNLRYNEEVATVEINRPEVLNALNSKTKQELTEAFRAIKNDSDTRVVILTGAGSRAFSAGQDINESRNIEGEEAEDWVDEFYGLYEELIQFDIPVIAKLNGSAVGSGLQLALLCDIRIAAEDAEFGMNEINIGIPCILGAWIIQRLASTSAAIEITLQGNLINANRARELELVNEVMPSSEFDEYVEQMANELAEKPQESMKKQKKWLRELRFNDELENVSKKAGEVHTEIYSTGEPEKYMGEFITE